MIPDELFLQHAARIVELKKGETLFDQGSTATSFYQVRTGKVKMVSYNEQGREFVQGLFTEGQSFGEEFGARDWNKPNRQRWNPVLGAFQFPCWVDTNRQGYLQPLEPPLVKMYVCGITPYDETLRIDYPAYRIMIEWYLTHGVGGLYANCLSSEMYLLNDEERLQLITTTMTAAQGRVPVAATGNLGDSIETHIAFCRAVAAAGADIPGSLEDVRQNVLVATRKILAGGSNGKK